MPPLLGRRRTRSNGAGKSTAVEDFAHYSVEDAQDAVAAWEESGGARKSAAAEDLAMPLRETVVQDAAAAWKEGNKMQQPRRLDGGEQGVPERPNPLRRRSSLRYPERVRKNRSIRGFCFLSFLIYVFVRRVLFPHWGFFSLLHCLCIWSIILGVCRICCPFDVPVVPVVSRRVTCASYPMRPGCP
jgi:hypothetical protein